MQKRVAGAARSMVKRGGDDARGRNQSASAATVAYEHRSVLVVTNHLIDSLAMRLADFCSAILR